MKPVSEWTGEWDPWIGFYKRLQRELSDEVEWEYVPIGDFLGAWWHWTEWSDSSGKAHEVYLQIEQGPLCFKIAAGNEEADKDKRAALRELWRERIFEKAMETRIDVKRTGRMGNGKWMTVGRIELSDWMAKRPDGLLDMPGTLANLRAAATVVDLAAGA